MVGTLIAVLMKAEARLAELEARLAAHESKKKH
jgi:hypothetical protein